MDQRFSLGDEGDFVDKQQSEALRAEAKALFLAQSQADVQAGVRQREMDVYMLNLGNTTLQLNAVQFSVPPEE